MVTKEQINRINELSRKSKTPEGLTAAEREEQNRLRRIYIESFKTNLRAQLDNIKIIDGENTANEEKDIEILEGIEEKEE